MKSMREMINIVEGEIVIDEDMSSSSKMAIVAAINQVAQKTNLETRKLLSTWANNIKDYGSEGARKIDVQAVEPFVDEVNRLARQKGSVLDIRDILNPQVYKPGRSSNTPSARNVLYNIRTDRADDESDKDFYKRNYDKLRGKDKTGVPVRKTGKKIPFPDIPPQLPGEYPRLTPEEIAHPTDFRKSKNYLLKGKPVDIRHASLLSYDTHSGEYQLNNAKFYGGSFLSNKEHSDFSENHYDLGDLLSNQRDYETAQDYKDIYLDVLTKTGSMEQALNALNKEINVSDIDIINNILRYVEMMLNGQINEGTDIVKNMRDLLNIVEGKFDYLPEQSLDEDMSSSSKMAIVAAINQVAQKTNLETRQMLSTWANNIKNHGTEGARKVDAQAIAPFLDEVNRLARQKGSVLDIRDILNPNTQNNDNISAYGEVPSARNVLYNIRTDRADDESDEDFYKRNYNKLRGKDKTGATKAPVTKGKIPFPHVPPPDPKKYPYLSSEEIENPRMFHNNKGYTVNGKVINLDYAMWTGVKNHFDNVEFDDGSELSDEEYETFKKLYPELGNFASNESDYDLAENLTDIYLDELKRYGSVKRAIEKVKSYCSKMNTDGFENVLRHMDRILNGNQTNEGINIMENMRDLINIVEAGVRPGTYEVPAVKRKLAGEPPATLDKVRQDDAAGRISHPDTLAKNRGVAPVKEEPDDSFYQGWIKNAISNIHPQAMSPDELKAAVAAETGYGNHPNFDSLFDKAYRDFYGLDIYNDEDDEDDYTDWSMRQGEMGNPNRGLDEKSSSEAQARFMAACAHGAGYDSCPSSKVSKEFNKADKGTKRLSNAMKHKTEEGCGMMEEEGDPVADAMKRFESLVLNYYVEPEIAFDKVADELTQEGHGQEVIDAFAQALNNYGNEEREQAENMPPETFDRSPLSHLSNPATFEDEMGEAIELHPDQGLGTEEGWFIVAPDGMIASGPYRTEGDARRKSAYMEWYNRNPQEYSFEYGLRDEDGMLIDMEGNSVTSMQEAGVAPNSPRFNRDVEKIKMLVHSQGIKDGEIAAETGNPQRQLDASLQLWFAYADEVMGDEPLEAITDEIEAEYNRGFEEGAGVVTEDLNNGYYNRHVARGMDYFPNGADGPVVNKTGAAGARHGDNPEQKKMQVTETHKELVYKYRAFLKENTSK